MLFYQKEHSERCLNSDITVVNGRNTLMCKTYDKSNTNLLITSFIKMSVTDVILLAIKLSFRTKILCSLNLLYFNNGAYL